MMYPAFLAQSYIAWSETALYLFVWLLFWLLLRFEDKQDLSLSVLIGVVLGIIYMMHNRSIGILAAYCAVGFIAALSRRINWKYYAVSVIVLGLMLAGCTWVKNILLIKYAKNFESPSLSGNGIPAIINKFRMLSPAELCRGLTASLSGQVWYLLAATGMLVLWGIILCLGHIKQKEKFLFYGTALAALAATMAVSGIWWMDLLHYAESLKVEGNGLFYGRYNECVLGIFLLLGMFYLMQNGMEKKNVILFLAGAGLMLVTGALLSVNVSSMDDFYLQSCNMFALEYYRWFGEFRVIVCTIVGLLAALALFAGIGAGKGNPQRQYRERVAVCFAFVLFWGLTALQGTRSFTMVEQRYTKQYNEMFDYLKALQADRFYVCGNYKIAADIQTRVVDSEVIRLYDVPEDMEENSYLLVEDEAAEDYDLSQFEDCYEFLDCTLYKK
jgi:hypothetical protein